jgi:lipoic acid synthetase
MNYTHAPAWLIAEIRQAKRVYNNGRIEDTSALLTRLGLATVCDSARCPNRGECYSHHTATFLILGEVCTRGCAFCAVTHGRPYGLPDADEPQRLARAVSALGLAHVVVTSVTRDDLPDGGAGHYACVVDALRLRCPGVKVELLVPDFAGSQEDLATVLAASPEILAHNVETVPRLYREVRHGADYARSITILRQAKQWAPHIVTKSGLMLGLGETAEEVESVLCDLAAAGCDMLTLGQYLAPSLAHVPVRRYVALSEFQQWREQAVGLGFKSVAAGPLVRSSYKARRFFEEMA